MIKFSVICVVVILVLHNQCGINGKPIESDIASESKFYGKLEKFQIKDQVELVHPNATSLILNIGASNETNFYDIIANANQTSNIPPLFRKENAQLANSVNNSSTSNNTTTSPAGYAINALKDDVEILQPVMPPKDTDEAEEKFQLPSIKFTTNEFDKDNIETNSDNLNEHHHYTLIIIGIMVLILCVALYTFLVVWRSKLDKIYGMREQLVTDDDYYSNEDIRQFSL